MTSYLRRQVSIFAKRMSVVEVLTLRSVAAMDPCLRRGD
jgi:hypothetical protein